MAGSGGEGRLLSATRHAFTVASRLAEVAAEDDIAEAEWITCGITEHPERTEWAVADTAEEPPALLRPLHRAVPQPRPPRTRPQPDPHAYVLNPTTRADLPGLGHALQHNGGRR